jgi:hypothetical protein
MRGSDTSPGMDTAGRLRVRIVQVAMRADRSPLTIAYEDPVFRAQGLRTDELGDAIAFFDLSQGEAHYLLCACHYACFVIDVGRISPATQNGPPNGHATTVGAHFAQNESARARLALRETAHALPCASSLTIH